MMYVMRMLPFFVLILFISSIGCTRPKGGVPVRSDINIVNADNIIAKDSLTKGGKGALLLSRFNSMEEFKSVVQIEYSGHVPGTDSIIQRKSGVRLTHRSGNKQVICILEPGISQLDYLNARSGTFWDRARIGLISPYSVMYRGDLMGVEILARRRYFMFGEGDVAFYDLAETMVHHIDEEDALLMSTKDLSEKGYLNTFNHITAQAFMTSIFSEKLADFVSAVHERYYTPELITAMFTEDQIADIENGPVDNYLDMINNEWGQELGKVLKAKYQISRETYWTPELLQNYLNDIQNYHSWAFQISFRPFKATDEKVIRFADKINSVLKDVSELIKYYD